MMAWYRSLIETIKLLYFSIMNFFIATRPFYFLSIYDRCNWLLEPLAFEIYRVAADSRRTTSLAVFFNNESLVQYNLNITYFFLLMTLKKSQVIQRQTELSKISEQFLIFFLRGNTWPCYSQFFILVVTSYTTVKAALRSNQKMSVQNFGLISDCV